MASSGKWIDGIGPETSVADAARRSLETRLAVVAHALPLAALLSEHDIEHVHRLRVATRRAAAALKLYRDWLPQKTRRWFKKRLRQIRRAASEARDLDVLIERLRHESDTQSEPVVRYLAKKRAAVQPDIIELSDDMRRDDRFVRKAARLFRKIDAVNGESEHASADRFCEWAPQQLDRFRADFVELLPDGLEDVAALHQFRICTKALRYAVELLAPAFDPQLKSDVYPSVEDLQERLGNITDHIAAIRLYAEWEEYDATHAPHAGERFLDVEKTRELEDLRAFREWWTSERADRLVQSLADQTGVGCR